MALYCVIRFRGTMAGDWSAWFAGMQQLNDAPDETVLVGSLPDQAALFGVLASIRNLNLQLISVRVEATPADSSGRRPSKEGTVVKLMSILTLILLFVQIGSGLCIGAEQTITPSLARYHMIQGLIVFAVAAFTLIWAMVKVSRKRSR